MQRGKRNLESKKQNEALAQLGQSARLITRKMTVKRQTPRGPEFKQNQRKSDFWDISPMPHHFFSILR